MLPSGEPAPTGWKRGQSSRSRAAVPRRQFTGAQVGSAAISVVGPAMGEPVDTGRNRTVGGVPTTSLRREVINRMIRENGWVVNDYQKEIGGKQVYVVVAQSQATSGRVQSRMFYFTEVDGRIYSVATNSPAEAAERLAEESEKVINSLQSRVRPAQQAGVASANVMNRDQLRANFDHVHTHHNIMSYEQQQRRIADHPARTAPEDDGRRRIGPPPHDQLGSAGPRPRPSRPAAGLRADDAVRHKAARIFGADRRAEAPFRRKPRARLFVRLEGNVPFPCQSLQSEGAVGAVFRAIPYEIKTFEASRPADGRFGHVQKAARP